jgi:hypothetical protein
MSKHWVNVFLSPYDSKRFYLSMTHPTKKRAVESLGKGKKGNKNQTFIATIKIEIPNEK